MNFYEIAGLILSVAQMALHLIALDNYKDKLEDMATQLKTWADINKTHYKIFRDADPDFYTRYQELTDYGVCESNIARSKGHAFFKYGNTLRKATRVTRGFAPLGAVLYANKLGIEPVGESAANRGATRISEMARVDDSILTKWATIASIPVGRESHKTAAFNGIIDQTFRSLKSHAQGFNSAGASFGTYLYKVLS